MNFKHFILVIGLTASPMLALAQSWRGNSCWGYGFPGFFGGGWMMILWTVLVIGIIFIIVRWAGGSSPKRLASHNAMGILTERYAKGEISREDFLKLKEDLS